MPKTMTNYKSRGFYGYSCAESLFKIVGLIGNHLWNYTVGNSMAKFYFFDNHMS